MTKFCIYDVGIYYAHMHIHIYGYAYIYSYIIKPPEYFIIAVNIYNYMINKVIIKISFIPLDMNIMLGPYKYNLQATENDH